MKHIILRCSETNDYKEWEQLCLSAPSCDIYFFPQYIKIYEQNGEGEGYCFVYYDSEDSYVLLPFIRRKINDLDIFKDLDETYYDIISPYGYGGPFIANNAGHKDENLCRCPEASC